MLMPLLFSPDAAFFRFSCLFFASLFVDIVTLLFDVFSCHYAGRHTPLMMFAITLLFTMPLITLRYVTLLPLPLSLMIDFRFAYMLMPC